MTLGTGLPDFLLAFKPVPGEMAGDAEACSFTTGSMVSGLGAAMGAVAEPAFPRRSRESHRMGWARGRAVGVPDRVALDAERGLLLRGRVRVYMAAKAVPNIASWMETLLFYCPPRLLCCGLTGDRRRWRSSELVPAATDDDDR
jgi:hypothetical protein